MQTLRKIASILFDRWWQPAIVCNAGVFLIVLDFFVPNKVTGYVAGYIYLIGLCLLFLSAIYHFAIKKRKTAAANLAGMLGSIVIILFFFVLSTATMMMDGDHWADGLTIPTNIDVHIPKGERHGYDGLMMKNDSSDVADMELYNAGQAGNYMYNVWLNKIEPGVVYLKAYEVTKNEQLSEERMRKSSIIYAVNNSDTLTKFAPPKDFTIYEGDWEKFYAARFEVWFVPLDPTKPERKLMEKIYKVEGWMR